MPFLLSGLLLAVLAMLLFGGTEFDRGILMLFAGEDEPRLTFLFEWAGRLTSPFMLTAASAAGAGFLLVRRRWRDSLLLFAIGVGGLLIALWLGGASAPLRPGPGERMLATQMSLFPNLAAAGAASAWLSAAVLLARHRPWRTISVSMAVALVLGVGVIQLLAGSAWPSDVIGGWALGLFWTLLMLWLAGEDLGGGTRPVGHSRSEG